MDKRISYLISFVVLCLVAYPLGHVSAQLQTYGDDISYTTLIDNIKTATWVIFTIVALICFVVAAILFLTAGGEPEKIKTARSAFIWGIAGVAVGILAFTIITFVTGIINGGT